MSMPKQNTQTVLLHAQLSVKISVETIYPVIIKSFYGQIIGL